MTEIGGGFQIANNTKLASLSGFPLLESVGGAVDFVGSFDNATLPKLDTVRGGVTVDSDSEEFNCSSWNGLQKDNGIRGDSYECKGASVSTSVAITTTVSGTGKSSASSATATGASASGSSHSTSSSSGAAVAVAASSVIESTTLLGAVAVFIFSLF